MEVTEAIRNRKSTRAFLPKPVDKKLIKDILECARWAPSGVNSQPWQVAVVFEETKNNNILRYYGIGAQIIKDLKIKNMTLITKSPKKVIGLDGYGIRITKQEII